MAKAEYRSAIRSRKLIHAAFADLLIEKPLEKITVTDIVNRAQINRGTFYAHYADIPDVVNHLIQQTFSSLKEAIDLPSSSPADIAHAILKQVQDILESDMVFYQKIMSSGVTTLMAEQLAGIVIDYLLENKDALFPGDRAQYELAIRFCAGGLTKLYRDWFSGIISCSLNDLTQMGEKMLLGVIRDLG